MCESTSAALYITEFLFLSSPAIPPSPIGSAVHCVCVYYLTKGTGTRVFFFFMPFLLLFLYVNLFIVPVNNAAISVKSGCIFLFVSTVVWRAMYLLSLVTYYTYYKYIIIHIYIYINKNINTYKYEVHMTTYLGNRRHLCKKKTEKKPKGLHAHQVSRSGCCAALVECVHRKHYGGHVCKYVCECACVCECMGQQCCV